MRAGNIPQDLALVARRVVWFDPPGQALEDRANFLAHVMTFGTVQDLLVAEKYYSRIDFEQALENAPPGVFDGRSWSYWNTVLGRVPVPPMPRRKFLQDEEPSAKD